MSGKKFSWRDHFIELLVVIIGISIAFALEGWSETKKEKAMEVNYLNSLKSDLIKDREDMQVVLDSSKVIVNYVMETFEFIYRQREVSAYKRDHITSSYTATYFYPNNGTYISLVNSGSLNIIDNFDLKSRLAELYNVQYKELERGDNIIKNLVDELIYPYMLENIRFTFPNGGIEDSRPLQKNVAINMLGSYMNFLNRRRNTYTKIKSDLDDLISVIDEQLNTE